MFQISHGPFDLSCISDHMTSAFVVFYFILMRNETEFRNLILLLEKHNKT